MTIENTHVPTSMGIIMDGNRRWAKAQGLSTMEGHSRGLDNLKGVIDWTRQRGVRYLTVYAFSTENWNRSPREVDALMSIFRRVIVTEKNDLLGKKIRLRFIGQRERFSEDLRKGIAELETATAGYTDFTLVIALSYGGRAEIVDAVNRLDPGQIGSVTEEDIQAQLWSSDIPDPDVIIRTGGEIRLSNFLLWQSAYSELFFVDTFWPAFSERDLDAVLDTYASRDRRRGK